MKWCCVLYHGVSLVYACSFTPEMSTATIPTEYSRCSLSSSIDLINERLQLRLIIKPQ